MWGKMARTKKEYGIVFMIGAIVLSIPIIMIIQNMEKPQNEIYPSGFVSFLNENEWIFEKGNGEMVSCTSDQIELTNNDIICNWASGSTEDALIYYKNMSSTKPYRYIVKVNPYSDPKKIHFGITIFKDKNNAFLMGPLIDPEGSQNMELDIILNDTLLEDGACNETNWSQNEDIFLQIDYIGKTVTFSYSYDNTTFSKVVENLPVSFTPKYIGLFYKYFETDPSNTRNQSIIFSTFREIPLEIIPLTVSQPDDKTFNNTDYGLISWDILDSEVGESNYTIYMDNIPIPEYTNQYWTHATTVILNAEVIPLGQHNITIRVDDGINESVFSSLLVTINYIPLTIISYGNVTLNDILFGNIEWWIYDSDYNNSFYTIYCNGIPIPEHENISWTHNSIISLNTNIFSKGTFNITIFAYDGINETIEDTVFLTIINANLSVSSPKDIETNNIDYGEINWYIYDGSVLNANISVFINNNLTDLIELSDWNGEPFYFTFSLANLSLGTYNITIIVFDGINETLQDSVTVSIIDHPLEVTMGASGPDGISLRCYEKSYTISFTVVDGTYTDPQYSISINNHDVASGTWVSGETIFYTTEVLDPDIEYTVVITISDGTGESETKTLFWDTDKFLCGFAPEEEPAIPGFNLSIIFISITLAISLYLSNYRHLAEKREKN